MEMDTRGSNREFDSTENVESTAMLDDNQNSDDVQIKDQVCRNQHSSHMSLHEDKMYGKPVYDMTWAQAWMQFCQETSLHGLKQITEAQPFILRRLLWLVLVLAGTGLFLYQMITGIIYYYSYPVSVNIKINHNDTIQFPAITICNQNAFRQTVAANNKWYSALSLMFSDGRGFSKENSSSILNTTFSEIYQETAHTKHDMIVWCKWNDMDCSPDDFLTVMTDYGVCYTFNSGKYGKNYQAYRTGTLGGLKLLLNVEQYEYMRGPNSGAGFRVLAHNQYEVPLVREFGVAIPPGSHTFLGMTLLRVDNLPKPFGKCDEDRKLSHYTTYSKQNCLRECQHKYLMEVCNCLYIDFPPDIDSDLPPCTLSDYVMCVAPAMKDFNNNTSFCECPVPCLVDSYVLFNSIGEISDFDALNLLNSNLTDQLSTKFLYAQEVTQRVNDKIVEQDKRIVRDLENTVAVLDGIFANITDNINVISESLDELFTELNDRLSFHRKKGLEKVKYIMEHDFVRGWTILEERTLPFLTVNYLELIFSFKHSVEIMENARNMSGYDWPLALGLWMGVRNRFLERLDVAVRVKSNLSEVHECYKTGRPLLTYRSSLNRRYDMTWITVDLLQAIIDNVMHDQDEIYEEIFKKYDIVVDGFQTLIDYGQNVSDGSSVDPDEFAAFEKLFKHGCVMFNYNLFLYKTRIVDGPVIKIDERLEEFDRLNRTLTDALSDVQHSLASIIDPIQKLKSGLWHTTKYIVANASHYIENKNLTKYEFALKVCTESITELLSEIRHTITDLRLHGRTLNEKLSTLKLELKNMWVNLLTEYTTNNFYQKVYEDFNSSLTQMDFFAPYFANLLGMQTPEVLSMDREVLNYKLNADFHIYQLGDKLKEIHELFTDLLEHSDVSGQIDNEDEVFLSAMDSYRSSLFHFITDVKVDKQFYLRNFVRLDTYMQELSYEEIIQQPAYGLISVLGDIGGSVGLFLGASAMSLAEVFDVLFLQATRLFIRR